MKIVFTDHIFKIFYVFTKYQTQQKGLTTKYWIDSPGMYIARVIPLGKEDAVN